MCREQRKPGTPCERAPFFMEEPELFFSIGRKIRIGSKSRVHRTQALIGREKSRQELSNVRVHRERSSASCRQGASPLARIHLDEGQPREEATHA